MSKEFVKELKLKKMKTGEIAEMIADNQAELVEFYITQAHKAKNMDFIKELHEKMFSPKFVKALNKIIKVNKKNSDDKGLDCGFAVIIAEFLEKNRNDEKMNDELFTAYTEVINEILKKRSKKISKKVGIDTDTINELLVVTPDVGYISNDRFVGIYSQKMLRKLYYITNKKETGLTEIDQVKTLFEKLFGEELLDLIAINILLEKQESVKNFNDAQNKLWNLMTNFALNVIEDQKKKHITELIEYYCGRRKRDAEKDRDAARRINLATVNAENCPKFAKAVAKFKEDGQPALVKYL